jgi:hypothetical protein
MIPHQMAVSTPFKPVAMRNSFKAQDIRETTPKRGTVYNSRPIQELPVKSEISYPRTPGFSSSSTI